MPRTYEPTGIELAREHNAEYMREYRKRRPDRYMRSRRRTAARGRALTKLAQAHPEEYRVLYLKELADDPQ